MNKENINSRQAQDLYAAYKRISFEENGSLSDDPTSFLFFNIMINSFVAEMQEQRGFLLRLKDAAEATEYLKTDESMQGWIRFIEDFREHPPFLEFYALAQNADGWELSGIPVMQEHYAPKKNQDGRWNIDSTYILLLLFRTWCIGCETHEEIARKMIEVIDDFAPSLDALKPVLEELESARQDGLCARKMPGGIMVYKSYVATHMLEKDMPSQEPSYYSDKEIAIALRAPFSFTVEDHFAISGRGSVLVGRIDSGVIKIGSKVRLRSHPDISLTVYAIELNRNLKDEAYFCEHVGIMFQGKKDLSFVEAGEVLLAIN